MFLAGCGNRATHTNVVAFHEFCGAVQGDVGAEFERTLEIGRQESIVDHVRNAGGAGYFRHGSNIGQFECWVSRCFSENQLCVFANSVLDVSRIGGINKTDLESPAIQYLGGNAVCAAVDHVRQNNVITGTDHADDGATGGRHAGSETKAAHAAFECGNFFFQRGDGRVAGTTIGVSLFQILLDRFLNIGSGLINRRQNRTGDRIRRNAGMYFACFKILLIVAAHQFPRRLIKKRT